VPGLVAYDCLAVAASSAPSPPSPSPSAGAAVAATSAAAPSAAVSPIAAPSGTAPSAAAPSGGPPTPAASAPPPGAGATEKGVVRVGLLDPAEGPVADEGAEVDAGFQYFLATHGDRLGGYRVELRTADEGTTVSRALAVAHQLVDQDAVDAIVGVVRSDSALAIAGYLNGARKPLILTGAGADDLTQRSASDVLFRVGHTSSQDVMPLGAYACAHLGVRRAAIVALDSPDGWDGAGGFARTFTDGGCRIVQELYTPAGSDWHAVVGRLNRVADAVFAAVGGPDSPAFVSAFRRSGAKPLLLGDGLLTDELALGGERGAALGAVTGLHYAETLRTRENLAFRDGFASIHGRPSSYFAENGYAAAAVLAAALGRLGGARITSGELLAALRAVDVDAPRGALRFDGFQQAVNPVYIRRVTRVRGRLRNEIIATIPHVSQFWRYGAKRYLAFPPYAQLKGTWARP
jgi:branched-chain amino acid transport system substrate-binding protein